MNLQMLMDLSEEQKNNYWELFMYEKVLSDTEEDLSRDYEYYNKRLKSLGSAHSTLDISIHTVYHTHLKNIKRLLDILENLKNHDSMDLEEDKQATFFTNIDE